jgi:hypothetical protein
MTDFREEQKNEMEALEAIYPGELLVLSTEPYASFELTVSSQTTREDIETASCTLQFTYTPRYPDEPPTMDVKEVVNIDDEYSSEILDLMKQLASENLGMVMVFIIYSTVQEKLNEIVERIADSEQQEKLRKEKIIEEAERKKFEGTRVTIETFLVWQTKFDAEMAELKRQKVKEETGTKKLTGYELFMLSDAMDDSDVKFLEEAGEVVEVDESLFEDIDELNLDQNDEELERIIDDDDDS